MVTLPDDVDVNRGDAVAVVGTLHAVYVPARNGFRAVVQVRVDGWRRLR